MTFLFGAIEVKEKLWPLRDAEPVMQMLSKHSTLDLIHLTYPVCDGITFHFRLPGVTSQSGDEIRIERISEQQQKKAQCVCVCV